MLVLAAIRLHFLLAVSTHYAHLVAATTAAGAAGGEGQHIRLLPLPPNVPAADAVGSPLGRTAEVWVRAPAPKTDAGLLDACVVLSKPEWI
ncbi:hypothetical protein B0H17DRAFT_1210088 [Mycena rosella]|uniref:Secreted protein n=1 Tax=Mycena rosella TaxID=1033263 RepID=A0AAD7G8V8_MYCRO|nr:hypothetical protein B0H17DRAFT_1210088 [Mycena rosella]